MPVKCKNCGGTDIEVDFSLHSTVCTSCSTVLESSGLVSAIHFEAGIRGRCQSHGFVSAESQGGVHSRLGGRTNNHGVNRPSREITLENAKVLVRTLGQQLRLNPHCIDVAYNFYKMCLCGKMIHGRKNANVIAACIYLTCRTERTSHLLIDISEMAEIDVHTLGRTYLHLAGRLCITIPVVDPCLYILRYANCLEFGDKTHEVTMTAMRLMHRLKKDSMHVGRKPSGLCGAALIMAARFHNFNRTPEDVVKVVHVHKATLRRRLFEFGETPTSSLSLSEFVTTDLAEEEDPPSFKAARLLDEKRLRKTLEDEPKAFKKLHSKINSMLESKVSVSKGTRNNTTAVISDNVHSELLDALRFCEESTQSVLDSLGVMRNEDEDHGEIPNDGGDIHANTSSQSWSFCSDNLSHTDEEAKSCATTVDNLDDLDEDEIDSYILAPKEFANKEALWNEVNADYIKTRTEKEEQVQRDEEDGKPARKKRNTGKKENFCAKSADEAVSKMIVSKKLSCKIDYDVLNDLNIHDAVIDAQLPVWVPIISAPSAKLVSQGRGEKRMKISEDSTAPKTRKVKAPTCIRRSKLIPTVPKSTVKQMVVSETVDEDFENMSLRQRLCSNYEDNVFEDYDY